MSDPAQVRCRVCGHEGPLGPRCEQCGAATRTDRCPCCNATAGASPHPELRYACDVCGGPRVPHLDGSLAYSGREAASLRTADGARKARAAWHAGAIAGGLLLPIVLVAVTALVLVFGASAPLILAALVVVAPVAGFLIVAMRRAAARGREIAPALDAAWLAVASDVARQTSDITAASLAEKLGIDEAKAEELLALADVASPRDVARLRIDAAVPARAPGKDAVASTEAGLEADAVAEAEAPELARLPSPGGKP